MTNAPFLQAANNYVTFIPQASLNTSYEQDMVLWVGYRNANSVPAFKEHSLWRKITRHSDIQGWEACRLWELRGQSPHMGGTQGRLPGGDDA